VKLLFVPFLAIAAMIGSFAATRARADVAEYYIGIDSRPTIIGGAYNGLPNPNLNRLTFLYAHFYPAPGPGVVNDWTVNHYHSKGAYSFTGPNTGVTTAVNDFNGTMGVSNILPESPLVNDITMQPGSGAFAGMLRTGLNNGTDFNNLGIRSVNSLSGFAPGTPENFMFNSSTALDVPSNTNIARWAGLLSASTINMNLLSISPGLSIRDNSGTVIMDTAGQSVALGAGNNFAFTPVFTVADTTSFGSAFQAVFNLSDGPGGLGDSGRFVFEVTAVPEPSSIALLGIPVAGYAIRRWRQKKAVTA
jgi:hypothetical protein